MDVEVEYIEVFLDEDGIPLNCNESIDPSSGNMSTKAPTFHLSFPTTNSAQDEDEIQEIVNCLVCYTEIESQSKSPSSGTGTGIVSLTELCHVLNMPDVRQLFPTAMANHGSNQNLQNVFENCIFCSTCAREIVDAVRLGEEIKNLQMQQQGIVGNLKKSILTSCRMNDQDQECRNRNEKLANILNDREKLFQVVRKTFSQCWASCRVPVAKLKENQYIRVHSRKKIPSSSSEKRKVKFAFNTTGGHSKLRSPIRKPKNEDVENSVFDSPVDLESYLPTIDEHDYVPHSSDDSDSLDSVDAGDSKPNRSKSTSGLKAQGSQSEPNKTIPCDTCDRKFINKSGLRGHKRLNRNCRTTSGVPDCPKKEKTIWPNECKHCGKEFNEKETTLNENNEKVFGCDLPNCNKFFKTFDGLKWHHNHTCPTRLLNNKLLKVGLYWGCDMCDKKFVLKTTLKHHRKTIHEKSFSYFCEICGHGTVTKSMLSRHMIVHSSEKRIQCDECGYRCKRPSQLFYHKRVHTKELPHLCQMCGKGFVSNNNLKQHMATHVIIKDVPCPLCGKCFASRTYVTNHINSFHKKVPRKVNPSSKSRSRAGRAAQVIKSEQEQEQHVECLTAEEVVNDFNFGPVIVHVGTDHSATERAVASISGTH